MRGYICFRVYFRFFLLPKKEKKNQRRKTHDKQRSRSRRAAPTSHFLNNSPFLVREIYKLFLKGERSQPGNSREGCDSWKGKPNRLTYEKSESSFIVGKMGKRTWAKKNIQKLFFTVSYCLTLSGGASEFFSFFRMDDGGRGKTCVVQ